MTTNLKPAPGATNGELTWTFDLEGIVDMYRSYEATDLWPMLETQPRGLEVDFVRAERSAFVWTEEDIARIGSYGGGCTTCTTVRTGCTSITQRDC